MTFPHSSGINRRQRTPPDPYHQEHNAGPAGFHTAHFPGITVFQCCREQVHSALFDCAHRHHFRKVQEKHGRGNPDSLPRMQSPRGAASLPAATPLYLCCCRVMTSAPSTRIVDGLDGLNATEEAVSDGLHSSVSCAYRAKPTLHRPSSVTELETGLSLRVPARIFLFCSHRRHTHDHAPISRTSGNSPAIQ
jgi:hypothetical protein